MTTYLNNYNHPLYSTSIYDNYNGVLEVGYNPYSNNFFTGSGSLLYDGRSILTAAHVFDGQSYDNLEIYLYDGEDTITLNATVKVHENYDDVNINNDLAIVSFEQSLDTVYNRYDIYRQSDEITQDYTAVGYGDVGTGLNGYVDSSVDYKLKTTNTFDADFATLIDYSNTNLSWNPLQNAILVSDFDNGSSSTDVIGYLSDNEDLGTGVLEGTIAPGDSGGPAFIKNLDTGIETIAGIASYSTTLEFVDQNFDITSDLDSSFGEIAAYQRVSYYQEWIDKSVRENYVDAPTKSSDVKKSVNEDDSYAYFMVEFLPLRNITSDIVSVDYKTIDGTAIAGNDYVAISGTLNIYTDETYAIIAVELIDDNVKEGYETFSLEISNPSYGDFGESVTLTATRTIIDNDFA